MRINSAVSTPLDLVSGIPQGGILSPIIFTIYTADMEQWLSTSKLFNFADDTTTDNRGNNKEEIRTRLEEDAQNVLEFMASNGLVANQAKTEFLLLNEKKSDLTPLTEIKVGNITVHRTAHTRLLGVQIDDNQGWDTHVNRLISALNQRLFIIRRIAQHLPRDRLINVVHCLWVSKLRYRLQLCTTVQLNSQEQKTKTMKSLQLTQNRLLRVLNQTKLADKGSIESMLNKFKLLSVNQLAAEIKLIEVWKSINDDKCPLELDPYNQSLSRGAPKPQLRPKETRVFRDTTRLKLSKSSFNFDAARVWNLAPIQIKTANTITSAKSAIKQFCKALPV